MPATMARSEGCRKAICATIHAPIHAWLPRWPHSVSTAITTTTRRGGFATRGAVGLRGQTEAGFGALFDALLAGLAPVAGVSQETVIIAGPDGNDISLRIHRPGVQPGNRPLPCVVHFHGGGGASSAPRDPCYERWRDELAAQGAVVIGVEFRNAAGKLGNHPYPAGLHDCAAATMWALEHRADLTVAPVVVSGESGGGNLALAVALRPTATVEPPHPPACMRSPP